MLLPHHPLRPLLLPLLLLSLVAVAVGGAVAGVITLQHVEAEEADEVVWQSVHFLHAPYAVGRALAAPRILGRWTPKVRTRMVAAAAIVSPPFL
eukprot:333938-Pleurochrysis_carterae.AAC.1